MTIHSRDMLCRNFPPNQLKLSSITEPVQSSLVEDIIDCRITDNMPLFRVRWLGFTSDDNTLKPTSSFDDSELLRRYISQEGIHFNYSGNDVNENTSQFE